MKSWVLIGAMALAMSGSIQAEEGHEQAHGEAEHHEEMGLELNEAQIKALGLQFSALTPVTQVSGYAWSAQMELPLAHQDMVASPVSGKIHKIFVVHGAVKAEQPLFELESEQWVKMQQDWLDALAQKAQAERNFKRAQRLFKAGSLSEKQFLIAQTERTQARTAVEASQQALKIVGMSQEQMNQLRQTGKLQRWLTLKSPKEGMLFDLQVERNQRIEANTPLVHIGENNHLIADVMLPMNELSRIFVGQKVSVEGYPIIGQVAYIANQADPETQRVSVHVRFEQLKGQLLPGTFVRVHFIQGTPKQAYQVPSRAVVDLEGVSAIFVKEGEHIEPQVVELIERDGHSATVALAETPDAETQVVSFGAIFLKGMMEGEGEGEGGASHAH